MPVNSPNLKVAIITGAAQGIGKAIALRLAQDGLDVLINDLPSQEMKLEELKSEIIQMGRRCIVFIGDASQEADVQNLVDRCVTELGSLDVMVANAGIARTAPLISTSLADWDMIQGINGRSTFLGYKTAAIQMIKQGKGGRIIGASSVAGKQGFMEFGAYGASKFAVRGLTQASAAELKQYGITVNAYAPGLVNTHICNDTPLNPNWTVFPPENVAGLVSYLVKEESVYITGQTINMNDGMFFE
ncbi:hypothetical protein M422DRAFT_61124 [Sphaerobolus stellatus SS14]|uniref:Uncharacterized protein n=1 Tax=Sphaerobolus stellatus (strain SS14) TaxID=990650 RepID=A0A0C9U1T6_SPHS4|nr:hypothetical protein M422DRAFT_62244 [Sphaerobolus stellatus SS14]KIJ36773.1 hypothetical protein M422DRAFT_61124 [Sphaerobolus stellatus SS14]